MNNMDNQWGKFVVSLDFELMWGVRDVVTPHTYGEHIRGVHIALPKILEYFQKYDIKGTFATVGFLFFENKSELLDYLPESTPQYIDVNLSPYGSYLEKNVGDDISKDPYHFGSHLVKLIHECKTQEIGTHTFSHYYCLEPGQHVDNFRHDLEAALTIAKSRGIRISSIVFPRNQVNETYLKVCFEKGIIAYRDNENSWIYRSRSSKELNILVRGVRLLDAYFNITGHHCYSDEYMNQAGMIRIPNSRFLRPYSKKLKRFESLRLRRIKDSMTHAAKNNLTYHLWWHPHNFGINHLENFQFLEQILIHYKFLNQKYGFESITMSSLAERLLHT